MPLVRSHATDGNATVLDYEPRMDVHHDVLFVPRNGAYTSPGVYDRGRRLIPAAGCFRGIPCVHPTLEKYVSDIDPESVMDVIDHADLIYAGYLNAHYGHFLVSSLSRLWWLPVSSKSNVKLLVLNAEPLDELFELEFIKSIFHALGLNRGNFVQFASPVRIRSLTIPDAGFQESNLLHRPFVRLCNRLGATITRSSETKADDAPVYLSKAHLRRGVGSVINEEEFCEEIERQGVSVLYPETMPFADQVRIFQRRAITCGLIGSALHTSLFVNDNHLLVLNNSPIVSSNYTLIDKANSNDSLYLYPAHDLVSLGANGHFQTRFQLSAPRQTAAEFLRALDAFTSARKMRPRPIDAAEPNENCSGLPPPKEQLVSRGKPARQSSLWRFADGATIAEDAAGAVSGLLTGFYQFHTMEEDQPWWDVDLKAAHHIREIRIYNRLDISDGQTQSLCLLASLDDERWIQIWRCDHPLKVGGLDGKPFSLRPPLVIARYVRVQQLHRSHLHLDQIEIYGFISPEVASCSGIATFGAGIDGD